MRDGSPENAAFLQGACALKSWPCWMAAFWPCRRGMRPGKASFEKNIDGAQFADWSTHLRRISRDRRDRRSLDDGQLVVL